MMITPSDRAQCTTQTLRVGELLEEKEWGRGHAPLTIELDSLRRHVSILGRSGAGKSFTGMVFVSELLRLEIPSLVLDRTGEFADSLGGLEGVTVYEPGKNLSVSPFAAGEGILSDSVERSISLLEHHLQVTIGSGLTPLQARVLREALTNSFSSLKPGVTLSDLLNELHRLQEAGREAGRVPIGCEVSGPSAKQFPARGDQESG